MSRKSVSKQHCNPPALNGANVSSASKDRIATTFGIIYGRKLKNTDRWSLVALIFVPSLIKITLEVQKVLRCGADKWIRENDTINFHLLVK
jgi:hypothetical protein